MIRECYCNDDRAAGYFKNGHFSSCPLAHEEACQMIEPLPDWNTGDWDMKRLWDKVNEIIEKLNEGRR